MSTKPATHIFLDFDETLFDHLAYQHFSANIMSQDFDIDPADYLGTFTAFHDIDGMHALYHHDDHLRDATGLEWSAYSGHVIDKVRQDDSAHFCYPDAHQFIEDAIATGAIVRLLTFGKEAYQRYKISLCPIIGALPVHVVCEPKGDFLARQFDNSSISGILVDDKAPIPLPPNWRHVWINRTGRPVPNGAHLIETNRLDLGNLTATIAGYEEANRK